MTANVFPIRPGEVVDFTVDLSAEGWLSTGSPAEEVSGTPVWAVLNTDSPAPVVKDSQTNATTSLSATFTVGAGVAPGAVVRIKATWSTTAGRTGARVLVLRVIGE